MAGVVAGAAVGAAAGAAVGLAAAGAAEASAAEVGHAPQVVEPGLHGEAEQAPKGETSIARRDSVAATDRPSIDLPRGQVSERAAAVGQPAGAARPAGADWALVTAPAS